MSAVLASRSVREQIIAACLGALNAGRPDNVPEIKRRRIEPYTLDELPAIDVKRVREEIEYEKLGKWAPMRRRVLTLRFNVSTAGPDEGDDPMLVWITSRLDGQQIGAPGLVEDVIPTLDEWTYSALDQPYNVAHRDFRFHYHTVVGDETRAQ